VSVTLTNTAVYEEMHREHIKMRKQAAKSGSDIPVKECQLTSKLHIKIIVNGYD